MRYKELDALRGLAALLVAFFHLTIFREDKLFKLGTTGVDLFFMISGFVILLSLKHVNSSLEFVVNRVSRLYPTYWACVTFTFLLMIINAIVFSNWTQVSVLQYLGNMTMFQFYLRIKDLDGPYWTMVIEMIFYVMMLFLFRFNLLKFLKQIGVVLMILWVLMNIMYGDNIWIIRIMWWIPFFQFMPLFLAGTVFYEIASTNTNNHLKEYGILIFCMISQIILFDYGGRSMCFIEQDEYAVVLLIYFVLFTLFVNGKLKFIVSPVTLFLGEISYVFYLIHQKIALEFIIPFLTNKVHMNYWVASMIALFIIIILAALITYKIGLVYSEKMKKKLYSVFNKP